MSDSYDALLLLSFGGPEGPDDVIPFLENVLRGKNVPRERMLEVSEHYQHFGGVSPINEQNRQLIAAVQADFAAHDVDLPIYWGNRNWHPLLTDTLQQMREDGIQRALAFVTSAYSSYSGCRQYREDVAKAQEQLGAGVPEIHKMRAFFNHPGFVNANVARVREALSQIPAERHSSTLIAYTAHSIPTAMSSGCPYAAQLQETARLVDEAVGGLDSALVYQSRSGPPNQPWLEPDICDYLREVHSTSKYTDVVIAPIGFVSDHMEVLFDLDTEAAELCQELGLNMVRAGTAGTHPEFVRMVRALVLERTNNADRSVVGTLEPRPDICPSDCCPSGRPRPAAAAK